MFKHILKILRHMLNLLSAAYTFALSTFLADIKRDKGMHFPQLHPYRYTAIRKVAYALLIAAVVLLIATKVSAQGTGEPLQGCISMIVGNIAIIATKQGQVEVSLKKLPPQAKVNDTVIFEASKVNGKWKWVKFKELKPLPIENWSEREIPSL